MCKTKMSELLDSLVQLDRCETLASRSWDALWTSRTRIEQSQMLLTHSTLDRGLEGGAIGRFARQGMLKRAGALCVPRVARSNARAESILAVAYEIDPACVRRDLRVLADWDLPFDELLADLSRLRGWDVGTTAVYLGALRCMLVAGGVSCPWLDADD